VTTSTPVLDGTQTWNAGGVTFTGYKLNITNTASAAGSKLFDFQLGGASSIFGVSAPAGSNNSQMGFANYNSGVFGFIGYSGFDGDGLFLGSGGATGQNQVGFAATYNGARVAVGGYFGWASSGNAESGGSADVRLYRDGAAILAQRNSTNAQTVRVYNTYTDASNYERGVFDWTTTANTLTIGTQQAGTGSSRALQFVKGGTTVMSLDGNNVQIANQSLYFNNLGISNPSGGIAKFYNAGPGADGWIQWAGQARVTGDVNSNNTTTVALATGLSIALQAGRTYAFEAELSFTCTAAQGIRAAMVASGGLTATNIIYDGWILDSGANGIKGNVQATALGTVVANAALTGTAGHVTIKGVITVNVAGSLQVHFAQSVAAANNTTVKRGSYMIVHDMP
jgi:hypothetical protein